MGRRPKLANVEGKGKEKDKTKGGKNSKQKPYYTPQQFSIPQMLDLEGHQSL